MGKIVSLEKEKAKRKDTFVSMFEVHLSLELQMTFKATDISF